MDLLARLKTQAMANHFDYVYTGHVVIIVVVVVLYDIYPAVTYGNRLGPER